MISVIIAMSLIAFTFPMNFYIHTYAAEIGVAMTDSQGAGQTVSDGDYWIYSALSPYYYLDIPGTNTAAGGDNVQMCQHNLGTKIPDWDTWTFTYLGNGYYSIKQKGTNMCLDVTDASLNRGTNVQMCVSNGSAAQQWSIIPNGEGFNIKSKCNSMMLDVSGGNIAKDTNVWVWEENGESPQIFYLVDTTSPFKGNGTANDPYQIKSKQDLMSLSDLVNSDATCNPYNSLCYIQTSDIDLGNENFTPIGTRTGSNTGTGFQGQYNGNSHTIYNLNINRTGEKQGYSGLFGWSYGDTTISNLAVFGNVTCEKGSCVGGIVGEIGFGTKIQNCAFVGNVTFNAGGGGIVGSIWCGGISVENCYFNGNLTGKSEYARVGGIVGQYGTDSANVDKAINIKNNYAVGIINSSSLTNGGIIGCRFDSTKESSIKLYNNYYLSSMCSGAVNGTSHNGCYSVTDADLRSCASKLGNPFVDNGNENFNDGYPVFEWQTSSVGIKQNVNSGFKGNGTESNPYQISSAKDLKRLSELINDESTNPLLRYAYYIQTNDIDMAGEDFTPIGIYIGVDGNTTSNAVFAGNYDGNYHSIKNLSLKYSNEYCGLFGRVGEYNHDNSACEVKNLSVTGEVECYYDSGKVGGIIGELAYGATIKNCDYHGTVTADGKIGGIVGSIYCGGMVSGCYSDADITTLSSDSSTVGIIGEISVGKNGATGSSGASIESTYYNGILSVNNTSATGAICGKLAENGDKTILFNTNFFLSTSYNGGVEWRIQLFLDALNFHQQL